MLETFSRLYNSAASSRRDPSNANRAEKKRKTRLIEDDFSDGEEQSDPEEDSDHDDPWYGGAHMDVRTRWLKPTFTTTEDQMSASDKAKDRKNREKMYGSTWTQTVRNKNGYPYIKPVNKEYPGLRKGQPMSAANRKYGEVQVMKHRRGKYQAVGVEPKEWHAMRDTFTGKLDTFARADLAFWIGLQGYFMDNAPLINDPVFCLLARPVKTKVRESSYYQEYTSGYLDNLMEIVNERKLRQAGYGEDDRPGRFDARAFTRSAVQSQVDDHSVSSKQATPTIQRGHRAWERAKMLGNLSSKYSEVVRPYPKNTFPAEFEYLYEKVAPAKWKKDLGLVHKPGDSMYKHPRPRTPPMTEGKAFWMRRGNANRPWEYIRPAEAKSYATITSRGSKVTAVQPKATTTRLQTLDWLIRIGPGDSYPNFAHCYDKQAAQDKRGFKECFFTCVVSLLRLEQDFNGDKAEERWKTVAAFFNCFNPKALTRKQNVSSSTGTKFGMSHWFGGMSKGAFVGIAPAPYAQHLRSHSLFFEPEYNIALNTSTGRKAVGRMTNQIPINYKRYIFSLGLGAYFLLHSLVGDSDDPELDSFRQTFNYVDPGTGRRVPRGGRSRGENPPTPGSLRHLAKVVAERQEKLAEEDNGRDPPTIHLAHGATNFIRKQHKLWTSQNFSLLEKLHLLLLAVTGARKIELVQFSDFGEVMENFEANKRVLLRTEWMKKLSQIMRDNRTTQNTKDKTKEHFGSYIIQNRLAKSRHVPKTTEHRAMYVLDDNKLKANSKAVIKPLIGYLDSATFLRLYNVYTNLLDAKVIGALYSNLGKAKERVLARADRKSNPLERAELLIQDWDGWPIGTRLNAFKRYEDQPTQKKNLIVPRYVTAAKKLTESFANPEDHAMVEKVKKRIYQFRPRYVLDGDNVYSLITNHKDHKFLPSFLWSLTLDQNPQTFPPPASRLFSDKENTIRGLKKRMEAKKLPGTSVIRYHFLRALYANMSYQTWAKSANINEMVWIGSVLGHGSSGQVDTLTANHYAHIRPVDETEANTFREGPHRSVSADIQRMSEAFQLESMGAPANAMALLNHVRTETDRILEQLRKVREETERNFAMDGDGPNPPPMTAAEKKKLLKGTTPANLGRLAWVIWRKRAQQHSNPPNEEVLSISGRPSAYASAGRGGGTGGSSWFRRNGFTWGSDRAYRARLVFNELVRPDEHKVSGRVWLNDLSIFKMDEVEWAGAFPRKDRIDIITFISDLMKGQTSERSAYRGASPN